MQKVVYVKAHFAPVMVPIKVKVPTDEFKKKMFGEKDRIYVTEEKLENVGISDSVIDGDRLAKDLEFTVQKLEKDGFDVVSIQSVLSGKHIKVPYGTPGYSYTEGLIVLARQR